MEKKKILFIDRDGTLIREPEDEQVDDLSKLSFVPGAIGALSRIVSETDYRLVMVTNQDGLGTEAFPEETFWPAHRLMLIRSKARGCGLTRCSSTGVSRRTIRPAANPARAWWSAT